ncbi:hypothetical protein [Actinokineospora sp. HUAS TT18]|uniref:hypothetical protein n=1 Tax=Actinokineospora sp. HUAS TT18 TaxID=3447451 RepID=UPI003F51EE57
MLDEPGALPEFEIGDRVDVMGGRYLGDWGTVMKAPIDMRPEYVMVSLVRAHVLRFLAVERLQLRG